MNVSTTFEITYTIEGSNYINSANNPITPNKKLWGWFQKPIYHEAQIGLANTDEFVSIAYFEYPSLALWGEKCCIEVISPKNEYITELSSKKKCLNEIAFQIEKYCGHIIGCHSEYRDLLT